MFVLLSSTFLDHIIIYSSLVSIDIFNSHIHGSSPSLRQVKSKTAEGLRVATKPCIAGTQEVQQAWQNPHTD